MLYGDARYGMAVLFPTGTGASHRLERMMTFGVEAAKNQERVDFSVLAQTAQTAQAGARTAMQVFTFNIAR